MLISENSLHDFIEKTFAFSLEYRQAKSAKISAETAKENNRAPGYASFAFS